MEAETLSSAALKQREVRHNDDLLVRAQETGKL